MDNGFEASQAKRPCLRLLSANNKKAYDGSKSCRRSVDDALTGQHVAYSVLERANEKIRLLKKESSFNKSNVAKLRENVVASEAEVVQLKAELEASAKEKSDAEYAFTNLLVEKESLEEMLRNAEI
ncbi:hypothetical protein Fot_38495 [Forsythia ovata]|uniref:Uncharacterized protein n=1 Tax=Forsythia ovata TaxID=205694 RepID=A0ABD1S4E3_9LAMI